MRSPNIVVIIVVATTLTGCGGGSVEHLHESVTSPDYSSEKTVTRIHVDSDERRGGHSVGSVPGQPIHLHFPNGRAVCIEVVTEHR